MFSPEIGLTETFHHFIASVVLFIVLGTDCFVENALGFVIASPNTLLGFGNLAEFFPCPNLYFLGLSLQLFFSYASCLSLAL